MAIAFKINKAKYDALSDEMKAEYIAGDSNDEFVLDVSGLPAPEDTGPLKRALEAEKTKHRETKAALAEAKGTIEGFPDVDTLKAQHEEETGKLRTFADKTLRESVASGIASKISKVPSLLADKIAARISVDLTGDEPKTVFLTKDGKPDPEMTAEKLGEEFVAIPEYKDIMIASKASGGGAPSKPSANPMGGGAPHGDQQVDLSKPTKDSQAALLARIQAKKAAQAQ